MPEGSQDKRTEIRKRKGKEIFILSIEYLTKSAFSWIHFKMDFFKNLIKKTFCSTSRYLDGKEKPRKTKDKGDDKRKRKEKTRESEKRSYKVK